MHWSMRMGTVLIPILLGAGNRPAFAQSPDTAAQTNAAAADDRFNRALKLIEAKDYKQACPLFLESYQLDPVPGTLHALADCLAFEHRTASALMRYRDYLRAVDALPPANQARHAERVALAKAQIVRLEKEVPRVTLELPALAPADTKVEEDGTVLDAAALGKARPIDPGEHWVRVSIVGKEPWETRFTIEKSEAKIIKLKLSARTNAEEDGTAGLKEPERKAPEASKPGGGMSKMRLSGLVVGGVGVAGLIAGGVTGGLAWSKASDARKNCVRDMATQKLLCSSEEARSTMESAQTTATVSTVAFAGGAALTAAGALLWILGGAKKAESQEKARAQLRVLNLGPKQTMVGVEGVW